ncbi:MULTISPECIES: hypothetical protein [unclassified Myroides]|uniref:hypothetical protein n=1 Tax=unclassified Myroides TaxID=2642485 RepID=UPI003D2F7E0B
MSKKKYIVEYDPISWTGKGSYLIKENNAAKTPYAVVLVALGNEEKCEKAAKNKAEKIANALHFYDQIKSS